MKSDKYWFAAIVIVFLLALFLRLQNLDQAIVEIMETRQTQTAEIARNLLKHSFNIFMPQVDRYGPDTPYLILEFPIFNAFVAIVHKATGIGLEKSGRLCSLFFWIMGSLCLLKHLRRNYPDKAVFAGWIFYLFAFIGIMTSRVVQPESLVLFLYIAVLVEIDVIYTQRNFNRRWPRLAALASLACLAKAPMAIILAVPLGALIYRQYAFLAAGRKQISLCVGAIVLPVFLWSLHAYLHNSSASSGIAKNYSVRHWFNPELFFDTDGFNYYFNLLLQFRYNFLSGSNPLDLFMGLVLALSLWTLLAKKKERMIYAPLAASIVLYFFLFNLHTATHYYYHFPLLPLFAVSLTRLTSNLPRLYHAIIILTLICSALINVSWARAYLTEDEYAKRMRLCAQIIRQTVPENSLLVTSMGNQTGLHYYSDRIGWIFIMNREEFYNRYRIIGMGRAFELDPIKKFKSLRERGAQYYANCDKNGLKILPRFEKYLSENFERVYNDPGNLVIFKVQ